MSDWGFRIADWVMKRGFGVASPASQSAIRNRQSAMPNPRSAMPNRQRAGNGTRTRDPNLGKVVLYQLSYYRKLLVRQTRRRTDAATRRPHRPQIRCKSNL